MKKSVRDAIIAGNWKMNKTPSETTALINEMKPLVAGADCKVVLCVPFVDIDAALKASAGSNIEIGAENCHFVKSGAFTGEVSPVMLKEMGVKYVIIGHSERRQYFGETDATVNQRVKAALAHNLKVIICVGESLEQRTAGVTNSIIEGQVTKALDGITAEQMANVVIAYEPIWAIGTGQVATEEQAEEVHMAIRALLKKLYSCPCVAEATRILYGGSMNEKNAAGLLAQPDIDGGLIGGASLKPEAFATIIKTALKA